MPIIAHPARGAKAARAWVVSRFEIRCAESAKRTRISAQRRKTVVAPMRRLSPGIGPAIVVSRKQAGHIAAPDQLASPLKQPLPSRGRPHIAEAVSVSPSYPHVYRRSTVREETALRPRGQLVLLGLALRVANPLRVERGGAVSEIISSARCELRPGPRTR